MKRISAQNIVEIQKRRANEIQRELKVEIYALKLRSDEIVIEDIPNGYRDEVTIWLWKHKRNAF